MRLKGRRQKPKHAPRPKVAKAKKGKPAKKKGGGGGRRAKLSAQVSRVKRRKPRARPGPRRRQPKRARVKVSPLVSPMRKRARKATPAPTDETALVESPAGRGVCAWCREPLTTIRGRFCSRKCRQTAFRLRKRGAPSVASKHGRRRRFAYADITHSGLRSASTSKLIAKLEAFDGWALSIEPATLRHRLPLCPLGVRVCAWVDGTPTPNVGHYETWEAVLISAPSKPLPPAPGAVVALRGANLFPATGEHPIAFAAWLFRALELAPGDELVELPGWGADGTISRPWAELGRPVDVKKRRRRRRAPPGGQKHTPAENHEPRADPAPAELEGLGN